ncbi:uncharacterized protein LOC109112564 isoform X2 [Cyprinus carpio]|uniref:Uncharacterized protein LOC109112564 isoform X2 n=1 Tax=Cyprinus carpio TaxID=7962 RepID=A0A9Q9ZY81_CYPCA|nr:uncharacterized protein LOC109112564 isoform X2 [Cyprinus carpio]
MPPDWAGMLYVTATQPMAAMAYQLPQVASDTACLRPGSHRNLQQSGSSALTAGRQSGSSTRLFCFHTGSGGNVQLKSGFWTEYSIMVRVFDRRKAIALYLLLRRLRKRRRLWVHPINRRRREHGAYYHLVAELRLDRDRHLKYFRMSAEQMDHILSLIEGHLSRQTTNYRQSIEPKQRLAVILRWVWGE